jgi:hypothetical protein
VQAFELFGSPDHDGRQSRARHQHQGDGSGYGR